MGAVVDGDKDKEWPSAALPAGTDLVTSVKVTTEGWMTVDVAMHAPNEATAEKLAGTIHAQIDPVFQEADEKRAGKLSVVRDKTLVRIKGSLSPFIIGMIPAAIP
jgi:hypothetical protein